MNKSLKIIISIVIVLVIALGCYYFFFINIDDSKRFSKEYTKVGEDNVFVYKKADEIMNILEKGTGVVFFGFPECEWCQSYAKILNDAAKDEGLEQIYYFNVKKDRENNSKDYQKMVSILQNRLQYDEKGQKRIFVPYVVFVSEGNIIDYDYETSVVEGKITPEQYWTKEETLELKTKLKTVINQINTGLCTDCNK